MKLTTRFLLLFLPAMLLFGCKSGERKYIIGVSQCSEDIWRDKLNEELVMGTYQHDNVTLEFASANDDDRLQTRQIDQFVDKGVDLLIVSPNQLHTVSAAIDRAYDKGIPVILFDRKTDSKKYTAFIGADNFEAGRAMGEYIARQLKGRGNVFELEGLPKSSPAIDRHRGFMAALKRYPDVKLVGRANAGWLMEKAEKVMDTALTRPAKIDYVFAQNDRMAMGARKAALRKGLGSMRYTGIDALPSPNGGLENVRDGHLEASYIYPTRGDLVMQLAISILEGKPFRRDNYLTGALVTRDNARVLLLQNEEVVKQASRLTSLHGRVDAYLAQYKHQKIYMILFGVIIVLLLGLIVYTYRTIVMKHRLEEETANAKLQFFTGVSHELRTPLTLIAAPVEHLLEMGHLTDEQSTMLRMVQRNVNVLTQLVGEILDFRKVQNGKMPMVLSDFDLSDYMRQWLAVFNASAMKQKISLRLEVPETLPVRADLSKVERICYNLLSNAMKYTQTGGHIVFSAKKHDETVEIVVSDDGIGIPKDEVKHVFSRFFQASNASGGTGIGLALVKAYADMHHGKVAVESGEGKGASFIITLPLKQKGEVAAAPQPYVPLIVEDTEDVSSLNVSRNIDELIGSGEDSKPEVLIIDDNNDIRTYLRTILGSSYKVSEAADGKYGLELARRIVPDVIVSDVMMPVMDGFELCKLLKSEAATSHIPVILLTAHGLDSQRAEGYDSGADAYIAKPFSSRVLCSRVENLLKSRRHLHRLFANQADETEENGLSNEADKTFVSQLRKIIQDHLSDSELSVEKIGEEIGLSRVQLYRKVKALTGYSPVEMLRKARLARARHLLQTTERSISEVAYAVGFSTPSYFSKCYKEEFGIQPGQER